MKWIDSRFEIIEQKDSLMGMYEQIETAGRTCYKSIGTYYFRIPLSILNIQHYREICRVYCKGYNSIEYSYSNKYILDKDERDDVLYISTDLSTLKELEKDTRSFLQQYEVSEPDPYFHKNLTAFDFVEKVLKKNGHGAMLEHGTVYLSVPMWRVDILLSYLFNKYTRIKFKKREYLITTNYRVICEKRDEKMMERYWWRKPDHYSRPCVRFIMDRIGSQSVERHRGRYGISFAQESTRYCNYSKERFGGLTFVIPRWMYALRDRLSTYVDSLTGVSQSWMKELEGEKMVNVLSCKDRSAAAYVEHCENAEKDYIFLTTSEESEKLNPQDARGILPFQVKTEFIMTAFEDDWKHFFELRDDSHAHPDIQYIAHKLHNTHPFTKI